MDHRAGDDIRGHGQLSVNIIRLREACTWDGQRNRCGATTAASFVERTSLLDSFPHKHKMSESCLPPCVTCHQESDTFSKRLKNLHICTNTQEGRKGVAMYVSHDVLKADIHIVQWSEGLN